MNRLTDPGIGSAPAQITFHRLIDVGVRRVRLASQKGRRGHDLSRLAVTALRHIDFDPCALDWVAEVWRKAFYCGNSLTRYTGDRCSARTRSNTVDVDRARSTKLQTAAELGSRQSERVAQDPEKRHLGRDVNTLSFPVKGKLNGWHWNPPQEFPKVY